MSFHSKFEELAPNLMQAMYYQLTERRKATL